MDSAYLSDRDLQLILLAIVCLAIAWFAFSLRHMLRQQGSRRSKPVDRAEVRESARRRL